MLKRLPSLRPLPPLLWNSLLSPVQCLSPLRLEWIRKVSPEFNPRPEKLQRDWKQIVGKPWTHQTLWISSPFLFKSQMIPTCPDPSKEQALKGPRRITWIHCACRRNRAWGVRPSWHISQHDTRAGANRRKLLVLILALRGEWVSLSST